MKRMMGMALRLRSGNILRRCSGQAMVEYALISTAILIATAVSGRYMLPHLIGSYQAYFNQFYFMLTLPIP